jgi:alkyl sulfatase BDS1-like metallo-beta-lactamase superfamily hydrolase
MSVMTPLRFFCTAAFGFLLLQLPNAHAASGNATAATIAANRAVLQSMPADDPNDVADDDRGFMGSVPNAETLLPDGTPAYTLRGYEFLSAETAPDTVNPSLWRQARMGMRHGLYKVTDRVYQVRGMDIVNLTIIEGDTGLIVIDALMTTETARAALDLYYQYRPRKPIVAVLYNHSHVDHYGGISGLVDEADVKAGKVQIIAPSGFMESAVSENVLAGNAMSRRAQYQFGMLLPRGAQGQIDLGGAKALARGTITLIPPTRYVVQPIEKMVIDGVEIVNLLTPGTEAPAEMIHFLPQFHVLDTGELALHAQHQLLTLRGAEIRDANAWSKYLNKALTLFGDQTEILVGQHTWPVFGHERTVNYLKKQRDMYKWLNDQSLHLLNQGYGPAEIAETMSKNVPASLASEWFTQGYYGSIGRNSKAVYQKYIGWYDGNPANLEQLTPADYGRKFVEYGGGAKNILRRAEKDYSRGDYRWVAQAMSHLVFADPKNRQARELEANALEQLGYQAKSAVERNAYLKGAQELRDGIPAQAKMVMSTASAGTVKALSIENIFDLMGVRLNAHKAEGKHIVVNWNFTDSKQRYTLNLEDSALTFTSDSADPLADVSLDLTRETLNAILLKQTSPKKAMEEGAIVVTGNPRKLMELLTMLDEFAPDFEIVAPNPAPALVN